MEEAFLDLRLAQVGKTRNFRHGTAAPTYQESKSWRVSMEYGLVLEVGA